MRSRIRKLVAVGSTWMSDARSFSAWTIKQVDIADDRRLFGDRLDVVHCRTGFVPVEFE